MCERNKRTRGLICLLEEDLTPQPNPGTTPECEPHTPCPATYLNWHAWAEEMSKTHTQRQCKGCGLYKIWEPREQMDPAAPTGD